ncbi:hypothetical protein HAX54_029570, partial [Datura stramonium]|nr:hypothetical protein [Datura stramonium]
WRVAPLIADVVLSHLASPCGVCPAHCTTLYGVGPARLSGLISVPTALLCAL